MGRHLVGRHLQCRHGNREMETRRRGDQSHSATRTKLVATAVVEGAVVMVPSGQLIVVVPGTILIMMTEIAVVLDEMRQHFRYTHPLMHLRSAPGIERKAEKEEHSAHARRRYREEA